MVMEIEDSVLLYIDKVRFRLVCSSWSSFSPKIPNHNLNQLPWLFQALDHKDKDTYKDASHVIFNLLDKKHYLLDLSDQVKDMDFRLFHKSWAVNTETYGQNPIVSLLNPLTGSRINLPGLNFTGYDDSYFLRSKSCVYRVIYSSNPLEDGCVMFALSEDDGSTVFCKRNDDCWKTLVTMNETKRIPNDIIFHNGKLYALPAGSELVVFDHIVPNSSFRRIAEKLPFVHKFFRCRFLVESSDHKDLMLLHKDVDGRMFQVYKHDIVNLRWLKVKSIGDEIIFVSELETTLICMSCRDFPGLKGNRIYFIDNVSNESQLRVFNLDDGTIYQSLFFENFPMGINSRFVWFTPNFV